MFLDINQNTDEWLQARAGKLTGSQINKVMANYGKAFGDPAKKLAIDLAVERVTGNYIPNLFANSYMERGHELEPVAVKVYEETQFSETLSGGFYDNVTTGVSPDRRTSDNGLIEVKCVVPSSHYKRIKTDTYDSAYQWQLAFELRESNADYVDYVSFCPEFPENKMLFVKRVFRDDVLELLEKIEGRVAAFEHELVKPAVEFLLS